MLEIKDLSFSVEEDGRQKEILQHLPAHLSDNRQLSPATPARLKKVNI